MHSIRENDRKGIHPALNHEANLIIHARRQ